MILRILRRLYWMMSEHYHSCPFNGCGWPSTHTWYGYQGDDLRDIDCCWWHSNTPADAKVYPE